MIDRRTFLAGTGAVILGARLVAEAQQSGKKPRIGVLNVGGGVGSVIEPFLQGLRDLGWGEGQNVVIERRNAEGHEERLPGLAEDLINLKVDVILASGGPASLKAARDATKTIPIVMVASSRDPIATGLIKSYAHPGGNITGIVTAPEELTGKQLEFLRAAAPGLSRVGFLWDATAGPFRLQKETAEVARSLGVEVLPFEVLEPAGLDGAFNAAANARVGGLIFGGSPMFGRNRRQIADLLLRHRLPVISVWRHFAEAGVLMAYGPSLQEQFRRAAAYVDKILKGAKPGALPVERPTKFELIINLKTAKALGLTIPPSLLGRADEVIQ
jgi:putative tryptophan/tyrosine transport system substrate-binding protein